MKTFKALALDMLDLEDNVSTNSFYFTYFDMEF